MRRKLFLALLLIGFVCQPRAFADGPKVFDVKDFGATGDGKTMDTAAIQHAIDACAAAGSGRVRIGPGIYLTGPIQLKSDVDLHVEKGALVLFSRNIDDYPRITANLGGADKTVRKSPITGENLVNVSITGPGIFDGQGDAWRPVKQGKMSRDQWEQLIGSGGVVDTAAKTWYPQKDRTVAAQRPALVTLSNCRQVLLDGPEFRNSPNWDLHPFCCSDVTVRNVTIFNAASAQNGDGIDIDCCSNVTMSDSVVNAGDDAICLKSGRDAAGRTLDRPTENVTITRCVIGTGHGGIAIGSEMSGGVRDITVSHCEFNGTDAGLRFKTVRGRGGVVENIHISDLRMKGLGQGAIEFDMFYGVKKPSMAMQAVSDGTPAFRNIDISDVECDGAQNAILIRGLPEMPVKGISLKDVRIAANKPGEIDNVDGITLSDVQVTAASGANVGFKNVHHLTTDRVQGLSAAQ
jgi:polygalacturonase